MTKIKVKSEGKEEYWLDEYLCPYCNQKGMHGVANYCCSCGKSFENVEFEGEKKNE